MVFVDILWYFGVNYVFYLMIFDVCVPFLMSYSSLCHNCRSLQYPLLTVLLSWHLMCWIHGVFPRSFIQFWWFQCLVGVLLRWKLQPGKNMHHIFFIIYLHAGLAIERVVFAATITKISVFPTPLWSSDLIFFHQNPPSQKKTKEKHGVLCWHDIPMRCWFCALQSWQIWRSWEPGGGCWLIPPTFGDQVKGHFFEAPGNRLFSLLR